MRIAGLLLAAGASSRMRGADKLLEEIDGEPLLRRAAEAAVAAFDPVIVALPPGAEARRAALKGMPVQLVEVADAQDGMAASLVASAGAAPDGPICVLLADMPEIGADALRRLAAAFDGAAILRAASENGIPGNPVIFPDWARPEMARLSGDRGARDVLNRHADRVQLCPLPGRAALTDLDTPEAWAAWRASQTP